MLSPVTASPIFWVVDFSSWGWTAEATLKSQWMIKAYVGRYSRVDGTLDVVSGLLDVGLLGVGLGGGGSLVT